MYIKKTQNTLNAAIFKIEIGRQASYLFKLCIICTHRSKILFNAKRSIFFFKNIFNQRICSVVAYIATFCILIIICSSCQYT